MESKDKKAIVLDINNRMDDISILFELFKAHGQAELKNKKPFSKEYEDISQSIYAICHNLGLLSVVLASSMTKKVKANKKVGK